MTSDAYQTTYHLPWAPAPHATGELAVFHLLASDLATARAMLEHAGRGVTATTDAQGRLTSLFVAADPRDGLVYEIRQRPPEDWLRERIARTGEQLEFVNLDPEQSSAH